METSIQVWEMLGEEVLPWLFGWPFLDGLLLRRLLTWRFVEFMFSSWKIPGPCQKAKENFELALEADNSNTHARYWLAKLHMKYHVPGKCVAM